MESSWTQILTEHRELVSSCLEDRTMMRALDRALELMVRCYRQGGKLLFCGNGGSASDSEHLAAEFTGRFQKDRPSLAAISLTTNTSQLTAIANDYGYEQVFARLVSSLGQEGDILLAFTTSGTSVNVLQAIQKAREIGLDIISFCGSFTDRLVSLSDVVLSVPHQSTARIQELHILLGHMLCEMVEKQLYGE